MRIVTVPARANRHRRLNASTYALLRNCGPAEKPVDQVNFEIDRPASGRGQSSCMGGGVREPKTKRSSSNAKNRVQVKPVTPRRQSITRSVPLQAQAFIRKL